MDGILNEGAEAAFLEDMHSRGRRTARRRHLATQSERRLVGRCEQLARSPKRLVHQAFGGVVCRAESIMHGKTSFIKHSEDQLFEGVQNPFEATRYHSLIVRREGLPECLEVTAWTEDDTIMSIRHRELPVFGVQFHPESILTGEGKKVLKNFLDM